MWNVFLKSDSIVHGFVHFFKIKCVIIRKRKMLWKEKKKIASIYNVIISISNK